MAAPLQTRRQLWHLVAMIVNMGWASKNVWLGGVRAEIPERAVRLVAQDVCFHHLMDPRR